jgi:hypothetical protein
MDEIRLVDLADAQSIIEDQKHEEKLILGPAIMVPLQDVAIEECKFDGDPESLFIELPENRYVIGVIGVRATTFRLCQFRNVGIGGTSQAIAQFKKGFNLK